MIDVNTFQVKQGLLKGVCSEAVELLKDMPVARGALKELRHVNPMRQIEISELMITSNNFTAGYAQCLVAATPNSQLTIPAATKLKKQFTAEELSRIEREMASIGKEMRSLEDTHGKNVLILVVIVSYLRRLLANASIVKYLARRHPDLLTLFQSLTETTSLDDTSGEQLAPSA